MTKALPLPVTKIRFKGIIGPAMPQEVKDALAVLNKHFGGLVLAEYGVLPS